MDFPFSKGRTIFQSNHRSHQHRHQHHSQSVHSSSPSRQPLLLSASPSRSSPRASPPPTSSFGPIKTSGVILSGPGPGGGNGIIGNGSNGVNGLTLNGNSPVRNESAMSGGNGNGLNLLNLNDGSSLFINQASRYVRKVSIFKEPDDPPDAGLTLCGGAEVGLFGAIYVSRVAEDSLAEKAGLTPGDQILSANYISFLDSYMTCQQALHIICSNDVITFNIFPRAEALSFQRRHATYHWVDPEGRPVSPPPPDRDLLTSGDPEFDPLLNDPSSTSPSKMNTSPRRRLSIRPSEQPIRTESVQV